MHSIIKKQSENKMFDSLLQSYKSLKTDDGDDNVVRLH